MLISCVRPSLSMYQSKTTRKATWQAFYIVMANIHKLDLQNVFMRAMFEDKLELSKLKRQKTFVLKYLSIKQGNPWKHLFFPGGLFHWKLIVELSKCAQRILKKRAGPLFGARTTFLIIKQRIQDILGRKLLSFFPVPSILGLLLLIFKVASRFCFFYFVHFHFLHFHFSPLWIGYFKIFFSRKTNSIFLLC